MSVHGGPGGCLPSLSSVAASGRLRSGWLIRLILSGRCPGSGIDWLDGSLDTVSNSS